MKYRNFSKTALAASEIGFGTWSMGSMWGPRDDAQAVAALNLALDLGINFFDTAYVYGDGHSEELIGNVVRKRRFRDKVVVATKIPPKNYEWPAKTGSNVEEIFPASWIRDMTEKSLKNLQMDCVDLQQLHVWAPNWQNQGEWLEELEKLKKEGKIRFIGISINDHQPDSALNLVASGLIDSVQVIFNLFDQSPAERLLPLCREKNVAVIARVPFDEGSLTGTLTPTTQFGKKDWRRFYFKGDRLEETCRRVDAFRSFLNEKTPTLADLALQFCLAFPEISTVIPGMRKPEHVRKNVAASGPDPLTPETIAALQKHAWIRNFYE